MTVLQPPLLCEGWGCHPLCLSGYSSVCGGGGGGGVCVCVCVCVCVGVWVCVGVGGCWCRCVGVGVQLTGKFKVVIVTDARSQAHLIL